MEICISICNVHSGDLLKKDVWFEREREKDKKIYWVCVSESEKGKVKNTFEEKFMANSYFKKTVFLHQPESTYRQPIVVISFNGF